jgi:hypothetical protein
LQAKIPEFRPQSHQKKKKEKKGREEKKTQLRWRQGSSVSPGPHLGLTLSKASEGRGWLVFHKWETVKKEQKFRAGAWMRSSGR